MFVSLVLVACMVGQLGGEETDGVTDLASGDTATTPDQGANSGVGATNSDGFGLIASDDAPEGTSRGYLEAIGLVGGVAVTDHGLIAEDCAAIDFANTTVDDSTGDSLVVDYHLGAPPETAVACVVSWTYFGLAAGSWVVEVRDESASVEVY